MRKPLSTNTPLAEALRLYQLGRASEAIALCRAAHKTEPGDFQANLILGTMLLESGAPAEAAAYLEMAWSINPNHPRAAQYRALVLLETGRLAEAVSAYRHALTLEPKRGELWYQAARALERWGKLDEARAHYEKGIALAPTLADAHHALGDMERKRGDLERAIACYEQALAARPNFFPSLNNLAITLAGVGRSAEAIEFFERALHSSPRDAAVRANYAVCLADLGRYDEAANEIDRALKTDPHHPLVHESRGKICLAQGLLASARRGLERAIELNARAAETRALLGNLCLAEEKGDEAEAHFRSALLIRPTEPTASIGLASRLETRDEVHEARTYFRRLGSGLATETFWNARAAMVSPAVFESEAQIDEYRDELARRIDDWRAAELSLPASFAGRAGMIPSFNLPFQGRDDRPLKECFGRAMQEMLARSENLTPDLPPRSGKYRVGFITLRNERAFVRSLGGLMTRFSARDLEPVLLAPFERLGALAESVPTPRLEYVGLPGTLQAMVQTILRARLDVLYWFEIGTTPLGYLLAHHRLAPKQCASWGIQVTSGIRAIDDYLSSRWIERAGAQSDYTERLRLLDTLLTWQEPTLPLGIKGDRGALGVPDDANVYLCPQQIGKFTPAFDEVLGGILRADGEGHLVITEGQTPQLARRLQARFARVLSDVHSRIHVVPQRIGRAYAEMFAAGDVVIDPISFGGVNTTYDAIAMGKPIVTLPGAYQRQRYTAGCLTKMGMAETLATSTSDYIARAVRLGTDRDYRAEIERQIGERRHLLYRDIRAARELEETLCLLAEEGRTS